MKSGMGKWQKGQGCMAKKQDLRIRSHAAHVRRETDKPQKEKKSMSVPPEESRNEPEMTVLPRRKRKKRKVVLRVLSRLTIVAAVALAGFLVWRNWDKLAPENLVIWIEEKLSGKKSGRFPVEISGGTVLDLAEAKGNLALLTDTALVIYNGNGAELTRRQHSYTSPILKTHGDYILIADTQGTRFRLETRASTLLNVVPSGTGQDSKDITILDVPPTNRIVSAAVGKNGITAFVTDSGQSYTSEVLAYDKKGKNLLHRYNVELYGVDVAVSPDGKWIAVAGFTAHNGAMKSVVQVYSLSDAKAQAKEYTDTDVLLCGIAYFPNGTLIAIGDTASWVINPNGTLFEKQAYADRQLAAFAVGENMAALVVHRYGSSAGGELIMLTPAGSIAYREDFTGAFRALAPSESGALLLTSGNLYHAGAKGLGKATEVLQDGRLVCGIGKKAVVLGLTTLKVYTD